MAKGKVPMSLRPKAVDALCRGLVDAQTIGHGAAGFPSLMEGMTDLKIAAAFKASRVDTTCLCMTMRMASMRTHADLPKVVTRNCIHVDVCMRVHCLTFHLWAAKFQNLISFHSLAPGMNV